MAGLQSITIYLSYRYTASGFYFLSINFTMPVFSKFILSILLITFSSVFAIAQTAAKTYDPKKYKKEPLWIEMMNDPKANYYETLKAFRNYWKDRVLPREPFEMEGTESFEREVGLINEKESEKEREREEKRNAKRKNKGVDYSAEVRAFKGWIQGVKPWVRADGSILSEQERQAIIDNQQKELRETELKNGKK